jgi:hypothetical protein
MEDRQFLDSFPKGSPALLIWLVLLLRLSISGASMPYNLIFSFVPSGVIAWIVSPSDTLVTVAVTVLIGAAKVELAAKMVDKIRNAHIVCLK